MFSVDRTANFISRDKIENNVSCIEKHLEENGKFLTYGPINEHE
jgi:hypothetical protein